MQEAPETALRVTDARRLADEWALVLAAEGVASRVRPQGDGFALCVPQALAARAAEALARYDAENPPGPAAPEPREPPSPAALQLALLAVAALLLFFRLVTGPRDPAQRWFARGSADAERILSGEPWRAVTALTLHADPAHVLSNALAGAVFFTAVFQELGPGLGLCVVLVAGAAGNLVNAALRGSGHVAVGASTAVFAAVGVLSGLGIARRRRPGTRGRRGWLPFAAGLGLLAMLGTGERSDLWAHLFGFAAGALAGLGVALALKRRPRAPAQALLAAAAAAAILACWRLALGG